MNESTEEEEIRAVCGNIATNGRRFTRLYRDGRPFPLCCSMYIDLFQRAPDRFARGERRQTVLEELIEQMKCALSFGRFDRDR